MDELDVMNLQSNYPIILLENGEAENVKFLFLKQLLNSSWESWTYCETKENSASSIITDRSGWEVRSEEVRLKLMKSNLETRNEVSYSDAANMLTEDGGDHPLCWPANLLLLSSVPLLWRISIPWLMVASLLSTPDSIAGPSPREYYLIS